MSEPLMALDDWASREIKSRDDDSPEMINEFRKEWSQGAGSNPLLFPSRQSPAEWAAHFDWFVSIELSAAQKAPPVPAEDGDSNARPPYDMEPPTGSLGIEGLEDIDTLTASYEKLALEKEQVLQKDAGQSVDAYSVSNNPEEKDDQPAFHADIVSKRTNESDSLDKLNTLTPEYEILASEKEQVLQNDPTDRKISASAAFTEEKLDGLATLTEEIDVSGIIERDETLKDLADIARESNKPTSPIGSLEISLPNGANLDDLATLTGEFHPPPIEESTEPVDEKPTSSQEKARPLSKMAETMEQSGMMRNARAQPEKQPITPPKPVAKSVRTPDKNQEEEVNLDLGDLDDMSWQDD